MADGGSDGNKVELHPDGSARVTTPDGRVFSMDKSGNVEVRLETIERVSVENIVDLKSYVIVRDGDLVVHKMEFYDGGQVKLSFSTQGKIHEFSGNKIGQTITKDGAVVLRSLSAAKESDRS